MKRQAQLTVCKWTEQQNTILVYTFNIIFYCAQFDACLRRLRVGSARNMPMNIQMRHLAFVNNLNGWTIQLRCGLAWMKLSTDSLLIHYFRNFPLSSYWNPKKKLFRNVSVRIGHSYAWFHNTETCIVLHSLQGYRNKKLVTNSILCGQRIALI